MLEPVSPQYAGPLLTVYQWQQPLKTGGTVTFERCVRPDTVAVIAFLDAHTVLLSRELQLTHTHPFLDVPGGRVDAGETHEAAAQRELQEETGYKATELLLWSTSSYKGLIQFQQSIFLAKGLTKLTQPAATHDATEDITLLTPSFEEFSALCLSGSLRRSEVMLAVLQMQHDPKAAQRLKDFLEDV